MRTWPGPGVGSGRSVSVRTSGPPNSVIWMARIAAAPVRRWLRVPSVGPARWRVTCRVIRGRPPLSGRPFSGESLGGARLLGAALGRHLLQDADVAGGDGAHRHG